MHCFDFDITQRSLHRTIAPPLVIAWIAVQMPGITSIPPALAQQTPTPQVAPLEGTIPSVEAIPTSEDAYRLAVGDRIGVVIANVPEYTAVYPIMVDGTVNLPVIGGVLVRGMTVQEAAAVITRRYVETQVLVQPVISVVVSEMNGLDVAITGEVNRPGAYIMPPRNGELPTLSQALEQAGGITQQANLQDVQIRRVQRDGSDRILQVNLMKLLMEGDLSQNISLRDGDRIMLATATAIDPTTAEQMGQFNLSPVTIQVNLVGEVRSGGVLALPPNTPLNQALLQAGGFTNRARRGSVELVRLLPNGTISRRRVEIDFSQDVNDETNPILQNRDVVIVGRSTLAQITDTLGTILAPLGGAFSLFNLFSPFFSSGSSGGSN